MYDEILTLAEMLEAEEIPYELYPMYKGWHICYPNDNEMRCSVIEHEYSFGCDSDLLEIMGLLTEEEKREDSVAGYLTAKNVFNRIMKDWKKGEA